MAAARTKDELMRMFRTFQESRVLLTALELDVFTAAAEGGSAPTIAACIGGDARATGMLLNALVAMGVLEKRGGIFHCTPESRELGPARTGLLHSVHLWDTWSSLTDCVKTGGPVLRPSLEARPAQWTAAFIAAMHDRARPIADHLVTLVDATGVERMLDVGGGPATFALAFAQANPQLRAEVLDLPAVLPLAERHIRAAGLAERVTVRAGDLRRDAFGSGYDLVLLSAICHMLGEEENRDLLRRCAQALAPGGRLVIRDFILEPERTGPPQAALFALNMLVGTERGNTYTEAEYRQWAEEAGLTGIERPEPDLILARKV